MSNGQSQRLSYALASCKAMAYSGMQEPSEGNPALAMAREKLFGNSPDNQTIASTRIRNLATTDWSTNTDASTITMASIIIAWGLSYMDETSVDGYARDPFSGHWVLMTPTYQACKDRKIILPGHFAPLGKVVWDLKVRSTQGIFYNLGINLVVICDQSASNEQDWPVDKTLLSYMPELADELAEGDDPDWPLKRHIDTLRWFDWVLLHELFHCLISGPVQVVKETYLWDNCTSNPEPTNAESLTISCVVAFATSKELSIEEDGYLTYL